MGLALFSCYHPAPRRGLTHSPPSDTLRPASDGAAVPRMKLQVLWETLTSLGFALPCRSLSSHKLPWVTGRRALRVRAGMGQASRQGA